MPQRLVSALFDRWAGQPILVIGGGPSVLRDLPKLDIMPACVISANAHGFKQDRFKVDLIVNLDKMHCILKIPMEKHLRPFATPIVNRHSWADYRLPEWTMAGNSGMAAVAVAAALGGHPVIVTGIDMFQGGRLYFHELSKPPKLRSKGPHVIASRRDKLRLLPLREFCKGAHVRPMSGPMCDYWPTYTPGETLKPAAGIAYTAKLRAKKEITVKAVRSFKLTNMDMVNPDHVMAFTERELRDDSRIECNTVRLCPPST